MKRKLISVIWVSVFLLGIVYAAQAASLEEAKSLGIKAANYVKTVGKEKAVKELNTPGNQFDKGELYVTLHDINGVFLANPKLPAMAGQNHFKLKDPTGKLHVQEMISIAKSPEGSGWTTYTWSNPATKKAQAKKAWVQRVEGTDMYTLCGVWQ